MEPKDIWISPLPKVDLTVRRPVLVSLGCELVGAALPHPDLDEPKTAAAGCFKRFASKPPTPDPALLERLREFVRRWCQHNLKPLPADADTSVREWLESTSYPAWRKAELLKKWENVRTIWDDEGVYFICQSFVKDECYVEYKHARGINSRSDEFKCAVGPIFKLIEREVFKNPHFIKHVPVAQRPSYIMDRLYRVGARYFSTDYSSFEALFTADIMDAVEFEMYDYMTRDLPEHDHFMRLCREVLGGVSELHFRHFRVQLRATRMSGEMCTSLGNGFANLMFMLFLCELKGCTDVSGVVEGDDGLFTVNGDCPTTEDFKRLGLVIKMEEHSDLARASFCGLVFVPEDKINVTNPLEVLASFGWASRRYARSSDKTLRALLRCKALSYAHQYPGCPIISSLAWYGLRVTQDVQICKMLRVMNARGAMNQWEREQLMAAIADHDHIPRVAPPLSTRFLVEDLYGVTVEHQLRIERYLDALDALGPIDCEIINMHVPAVWQHYWDNYVQVPAVLDSPSLPVGQDERLCDDLDSLLSKTRKRPLWVRERKAQMFVAPADMPAV